MVVGIRRTVSLYGTVTRLAPAGRHPPEPLSHIQSFMKNPRMVHICAGTRRTSAPGLAALVLGRLLIPSGVRSLAAAGCGAVSARLLL